MTAKVAMHYLYRITSRDRWVLPTTWVLSAVYLAAFVHIGWIPHDEGVIGQSAERVLLGQLPHRDFTDVYTGGLSFLHALAFQVADVHLLVPRFVLYGFALAWIPCVYWIARCFVRALPAGGVTFACVAWSFPHYFVALPSWYNLVFATVVAGGLLKFVESRNRWYLTIAGIATGLSITAKITGLFTAAACVLFMLYLEADEVGEGHAGLPRDAGLSYMLAAIAAVTCFLGLLLLTLWAGATPGVLFHFFVPALLVSALILHAEQRALRHVSPAPRFLSLSRNLGAYGAGVLVPLAVFLYPFILGGAVKDLLEGVFITPSHRLTQVFWPPPPLWMTVPAVGLLGFLVYHVSRLTRSAAAVAGVTLLVLLRLIPGAHSVTIMAAQASIPFVVATGVVLLTGRRRDRAVPAVRRRQAAALVFLLACCTIIQFPYAYRIYFLYVAPMVLLAGTALYSLWSRPLGRMFGVPLLLTIAFATTWMNHRFVAGLGYHYRRGQQSAPLDLDRSVGLKVPPRDSAMYSRMVHLLRARSENGYTVAGPDAPEVYFLSGLTNPTPHLFELFGDSGLEQHLIAAIDSLRITAVAINAEPRFTDPLSPEFMSELETRFSGGEMVGRFRVMWRE